MIFENTEKLLLIFKNAMSGEFIAVFKNEEKINDCFRKRGKFETVFKNTEKLQKFLKTWKI